MNKKPLVGRLSRQYIFVLNPYAEYRFTRCPGCEQQMRQRKLPLFIHVNPLHPIVLNKTCRYCPDCDVLLVHQDELEHQLAAQFSELDPSVIGNDYLVLGTVDRQAWRAGVTQPKGIPEMLEHLHQFKEVQSVQVQPGGWYRDDMDPSEMPVLEPRPLDTPWRKQAGPSGDEPDRSREGKRRKRGKRRRR